MLPLNRISTPEFLTGTTQNAHQQRHTLFKSHKQNLTILYIIAVLVLCVNADDRFRPHRLRPSIFHPFPKLEPPETLDAVHVSTASSTAETSDSTDTTVDILKRLVREDANEIDPDYVTDVNGPHSDENYQYDAGKEGKQHSEAQKTAEQELNAMIKDLGDLLSNESTVVTIGDVSSAFEQSIKSVVDHLVDGYYLETLTTSNVAIIGEPIQRVVEANNLGLIMDGKLRFENHILKVMDGLLATDDESLEFPSAVLTALDALGARADLNGSATVAMARRNVAVIMADSAPGRPVRGLRIAAGGDGFTEEALEILLDDVDPTTLTSDNTDTLVNLPASLTTSSRRISFVVFRSNRAFVRHGREQYVVNSKVISVNVEKFTQIEEGEVIDIHLKPSTYEAARNMSRACAYWHFTENNTGYWSQEGCTFIKSPTGLLDTCRCTHLTHFAEILIPKLVFSEENETALEVISLIGCFLSLFGLIVIGLTAIIFRSWRNDFNNKIWIQLTVALLINVVSFLTIVFSKFEDYNIVCMLVGILLHYAVLASFCWMLVAAVISYRKLVLVFAWNPRRRLLKASAFSWLVPLMIVATLVAVAPQSYTKRFEGNTPTGGFCYPSGLGLWLSVFVPIGIVVISNWIMYALILRSLFGTRRIQKHGDSREMLRRASVCCLLVFLLGLPWVFGLFAYNIVAAYLFTLTTSYQGFVLFVLFILINTKTRGMWLNKLHIKKKTKAPVKSSLIISKHDHKSNEVEQAPFIEPSSVRTNITSLVSNSSDGNVLYNATSGSAVIEDSHYNSKDSDIDSFITAKSHENLSKDEIFKSIECITDTLEDEEVNNRVQAESAPVISADMRESPNLKKISGADKYVTDAEAIEDKPKTDDDVSNGIHKGTLKNDELISNERSSSNHSSQIIENNDDSVDPKITIYNVPTQSASLVS